MRSKTLNNALVGLLIATAPAALLAETGSEKGWSIEVKALDTESTGTVSAFTFDDKRTGTSLGGGYAFNEFLSVRAAYSDYGNHFATDCPAPLICIDQNVDQIDVRALSVGVTGNWPVTRVFELFATVGVTRWDADFAQFDRDESDRDIVFGGGIAARISSDWKISLQYEKVDDLELESIGIALGYQF